MLFVLVNNNCMKKIALILVLKICCCNLFGQGSVTTGGVKYVLLENVTGAWCQYCPDGAVRQNTILDAYPKVIGTTMHNRDSMAIEDGETVNTTYVTEYPSGLIDRKPGAPNQTIQINRGNWVQNIPPLLVVPPAFDVTMTHAYDINTRVIDVTVTANVLAAQSGNYNVNVFVLEDSVVGPDVRGYNQANTAYNNDPGHPYYQKGDPIIGYVHRHVLRAMLGGPWGTAGVIVNNPPTNGSYQKRYTYTIPAGRDYRKYRLIALVQTNGTSVNDRPIMNAIKAVVTPGTTGIGNLGEALADIEIFPNPAGNSVVVRGVLERPTDVTIALINASGYEVYRKQYHYSSSGFGERIALNGLSGGIYFIKVMTAEGAMTMQKLTVY